MADVVYPISSGDVRTYITDFAEVNYLIDGQEFSDAAIQLAMRFAVDDYNMIPPLSKLEPSQFPSSSLLMTGTLAHLFLGKAAHLARNTMSYSDGGLQIPIEERAELYLTLGNQWLAQFKENASKLKLQQNVEEGWGFVSSDNAMFPVW